MATCTLACTLFLTALGLSISAGDRKFCFDGVLPHAFDPATQLCDDGVVKAKPVPSPVVPVSRPDRVTMPCERRDLLDCGEATFCGKTRGFHCCGSAERYTAISQTCCEEGGVAVVHDEKPSKLYICDGLKYHRRGTPMVGLHPSLNDGLAEVSPGRAIAGFCNKPYAYVLKIGAFDKRSRTDMFYNTTAWRFATGSKSLGKPEHKFIHLPVDSFTKDLSHKVVVVLTHVDHFKMTEDSFYLRTGSNLLHLQYDRRNSKVMSRARQALKAIHKACKRLNRFLLD